MHPILHASKRTVITNYWLCYIYWLWICSAPHDSFFIVVIAFYSFNTSIWFVVLPSSHLLCIVLSDTQTFLAFFLLEISFSLVSARDSPLTKNKTKAIKICKKIKSKAKKREKNASFRFPLYKYLFYAENVLSHEYISPFSFQLAPPRQMKSPKARRFKSYLTIFVNFNIKWINNVNFNEIG